MPKLKTYGVQVWEEQGGYLTVKATSKKQAERKATRIVENYGLGFNANLPPKTTLTITHRDTQVFESTIEEEESNA